MSTTATEPAPGRTIVPADVHQVHLLRLLEDDESSVEEIAHHVAANPSIHRLVLQEAETSARVRRRPVTGVHHAVLLLGSRRLARLLGSYPTAG